MFYKWKLDMSLLVSTEHEASELSESEIKDEYGDFFFAPTSNNENTASEEAITAENNEMSAAQLFSNVVPNEEPERVEIKREMTEPVEINHIQSSANDEVAIDRISNAPNQCADAAVGQSFSNNQAENQQQIKRFSLRSLSKRKACNRLDPRKSANNKEPRVKKAKGKTETNDNDKKNNYHNKADSSVSSVDAPKNKKREPHHYVNAKDNEFVKAQCSASRLGTNNYKCVLCSSTFFSYGSMYCHIAKLHLENEDKSCSWIEQKIEGIREPSRKTLNWPCFVCSKVISSSKYLRRHYKKHFAKGEIILDS